MSYCTLNLAKKHLNIEDSVFQEDSYIQHLIEVAEATVEKSICRPLSELEDENGDLPKPLIAATLLYVGTLYNSRENVAYGGNPTEVPFTFSYLLDLYRKY